jgi:type III secretion system low calcium response chaperone LcrH/SycD
MNDTPPEHAANDTGEIALILQMLQGGGTIKDLTGVSSDMLEGVYALAYDFYQKGQLDDAETFFRFLSVYDFYNADYAMGLAAVLQMKKQYDKAIGTYAVAQMLDNRSDKPMFHMAQCHLAMGKVQLARECFEGVAKRAHGTELGARAQAYVEATRASDGRAEPVPADA